MTVDEANPTSNQSAENPELTTSPQSSNSLEQIVQQSGKYGVNIGQGQGDIHIGDRIGLGIKDVQALIQTILVSHSTRVENSSYTKLLSPDGRLAKLIVDAQQIEIINVRLAAIEEISNAGQLDETWSQEFELLKQRTYSLSNLNLELQEIANKAQELFDVALQDLDAKIQELTNLSSKELKELLAEGIDPSQHLACLQEQFQLISQFQRKLDEGKAGSNWLNPNITAFARVAGRHSLEQYSESRQSTTTQQTEEFYFSIEQFLERVSHCLSWGRYQVLDVYDIPLIFQPCVYEAAFEFIKRLAPPYLSAESKKQIEDYINYLILRLPLYPQ